MLFLADTHIALWVIEGADRLPNKAKSLMEDPGNYWYLSYVSVWEVALKHAKHPHAIARDSKTFHDACMMAGFRNLPLSLEHFYRTELLPTESVHGDPFDRMLLAQAQSEDMLLVTHDASFVAYDDPHVLLV